MRRIVTTAVAVALIGGAALAPAVAADTTWSTGAGGAGVPSPAEALDLTPEPALPEFGEPTASDTLATARRVLEGDARPADPSATLVLRDLWLRRAELRGAERRLADALLARPTDGVGDPQGFGYTVAEAPPVCNTRICMHYVPTGTDAPPSPEWVAQNLAVMDSVWATEVDQMGFRPPVSDGVKGGSPLFDVYLKDLGGDIYGFCAGEQRAKKRTGSGYCVLDNDFSPAQFPTGTPEGNLRVTAAHEFFHAVQYAYDYAEDPWMMESTATWMEERLASDVNDNRQYLPRSQIYVPYLPLDLFSRTDGFQYGNWVFWEHLSSQYGTSIVKKAWQQAGSLKQDGGKYSLTALQKVLKKKGGLTKVYATYAAGNLTPAANFPEGAEYPAPRVRGAKALSKNKRSKRFAVKINHLSSASYVYTPGKGLDGRKWKLAVAVKGPLKRTSPAAVVVAHLGDGTRQVKMVRLNRGGDGRTKIAFDNTKVAAVSVTLVNASTRYRCGQRTVLACAGLPLDDKARFSVTGRVTKR
ncbi:MXAN_6640 family putative metalloprotease [Nocardioides sp. SYSU D00065]|uniref:MXAN_6640 family putative metalloprotease n=1 Tax=Nocardioides sp. SYSU D00065 TaxID=2817378 RepID=UPI001B339DDC|nr:MXAN_6640 family putative metalloprotease [Nocardioides sp. SYSU D00065]